MPKMIRRPMGGKRMHRPDEDDDDDDDDDDEEEQETQTQQQAAASSSSDPPADTSGGGQAEDEDASEDEESDEEDDDEPRRKSSKAPKERPAKKPRRQESAQPGAQFIDREAEASDEDEDDEEDDDDEVDNEELGDDDADNVSGEVAERQARRLDAARRKKEEEELADYTKNRYESGRVGQRYAEDDEDTDARFQDLPDAQRDPKLWLLRCKPGHERLLVIQLMQKFLDAAHTDKSLQIASAMHTDIKGYIYVESYKEAHVREACQGLNNLWGGKIVQVPVKEMTDVLRVRTVQKEKLVRGSWVRMRRNDDYKDDLAQVIDLEPDGARARIRIIPRLKIYTAKGDDDAQERKIRPPARLFKPEEIGKLGGDVEGPMRVAGGRQQFAYDGMTFEDGCLVKVVSIKGLRWGDDVTPSLPELERFKVGMGSAADDELLAAATVAKSARQMLAVGDLVKVIDGDLKNLMGKVHSVSVDGNMVTILPKHEKLKEPLSFQAELLVKWFKMGDHIKIVGGTRHVGETGMVVKVGTGADDEAEGGEKQKAKRSSS